MKRKLVSLIPLVVMACVIFYFSAKNGEQSTCNSISVTEQIDSLFKGSLVQKGHINLLVLNHIIRKAAHVCEYAIFSFLAGLHIITWNVSRKKIWMYSVILSFLYACTDEFHQYFVPGRSAQFKDVLIDSSGAMLGAFVFVLIIYRVIKQKAYDGK